MTSMTIQEYAQSELTESLLGNPPETADNLKQRIEDAADEATFDLDAYAPYTSQEIELIEDEEREFWQEAEAFLSQEKEYTASQWEEARRAYAAAIGYAAFSHHIHAAKDELIEAIDDMTNDDALADVKEPKFDVSRSCTHGWAPHDRESEDGTHYWAAQLEGCKAIAKQVCGIWLTITWTPKHAKLA